MKMRAAVLRQIGLPAPYAESRPLSIEEVDLADPGPGELRVKIHAAGLCHSDLSAINGDRPWPVPIVPGHEAAAEVLERWVRLAPPERGETRWLTGWKARVRAYAR